MALLCRFIRLLHMICYAPRAFEQSVFLRFLAVLNVKALLFSFVVSLLLRLIVQVV